MISVAIIDIIGLTYDGNTLNKRGLGGSESAVILLAKELSKNYPRGEKQLLGPFHTFGCQDTMTWFKKNGVSLKIENDGRVFPTSDNSQTIIDCFLNLIKFTALVRYF